MSASPDDLFRRLQALGIETRTYEHPPLATVADGRRYWRDIPGGHAKNLYLRDAKKRNWLVATLFDRELEMKRLAATIGSGRLSFGRPERLLQYLGVTPGAVTPFAVLNDADGQVTVVLDEALLAYSPLNFHPLVNTATTAIQPEDLLSFLRASGHEPRILPL